MSEMARHSGDGWTLREPVHALSSLYFWIGPLRISVDFIGITCTLTPQKPELF